MRRVNDVPIPQRYIYILNTECLRYKTQFCMIGQILPIEGICRHTKQPGIDPVLNISIILFCNLEMGRSLGSYYLIFSILIFYGVSGLGTRLKFTRKGNFLTFRKKRKTTHKLPKIR